MHGIILFQLKKYLEAATDSAGMKSIYQEAGYSDTFFDLTKEHPDEAIETIIRVACEKLQLDRNVALEEFGKFLTPNLMVTYRSYINPEWKCLDLLENVETTIHRTVRRANPEAKPPQLVVTRVSAREVRIDYTSKRDMIALGVGIITKVAQHYKENLSIDKAVIPGGTRLTIRKIS
jgi:hypothetical protein